MIFRCGTAKLEYFALIAPIYMSKIWFISTLYNNTVSNIRKQVGE